MPYMCGNLQSENLLLTLFQKWERELRIVEGITKNKVCVNVNDDVPYGDLKWHTYTPTCTIRKRLSLLIVIKCTVLIIKPTLLYD